MTFLACANGPMAIATDDDSQHKPSKMFPGNIPNNVQKHIKLTLKFMPVSFFSRNLILSISGVPGASKMIAGKAQNLQKNTPMDTQRPRQIQMFSISEQLRREKNQGGL